MFNITANTTGILQDVLYKCKISGSIVADPGTGNQILLAYSRYTGELLGSAVWDSVTKTYELFIPTIEDEKVYLTRIDNNGQYFAETYDRLSLCIVNNVHGESYADMADTSCTTQWMNCAKGIYSFPFNIIHENLKKVEGIFSFATGYKEGKFLVGGNYYPLGRKANGVLFSDDGIIVCDAEKSQNVTFNEIINSIDEDPFNDGSLIAAYPVLFNGKDVKRVRNSESNKAYRYTHAGYYGGFDDPKHDPFIVPIVVNRTTTTTIYFELTIGASISYNYNTLLYITNLMHIYVYNNSIYWEYLNPNSVSNTSYSLTYPSKTNIAVVISPSGNDKLYINGVLVATKAIVTPVKVNQEYTSFSMTRTSGGSHILSLVGAWLFNRELTLSEIQALQDKGNQKYLPIPQNINYVQESNGVIKTGAQDQEYYETFSFLNGGAFTNAYAYQSWYATHYGLTLNKDNVVFNGSTGILYRNSSRNTSSMDISLKFNAAAVTAQCLWKIGNETNGIAIGIDASAKITLYARTAGVTTSISFTTTTAVSTWYQVVLTGGDFKLLSAVGSLLESIPNSLTIGNYTGVESLGGAYGGSPITGTAGNTGYFSGSVSNLLLADANSYGTYTVGSEHTISVFDSDDNELPVELVKWNVDNNSAILWTSIPVLNQSGTTLKIKKQAATKSGIPGSSNAQSVWNKDFIAVYHMGKSDALIDSTSGKLHGTLVNIDDSNFISDKTGYSLNFNGTDEYVKMQFPVITGMQRLSVSALFTPNTIVNGDSFLDIAMTDASNSALQLSMQFNASSELVTELRDTSALLIGAVGTNALTTSTEYFTSLNYTGKSEVDGISLLVNGTLIDSETPSGKRISNSNAVMHIGKDAYSANYYDGLISELFIRNKPMSADFEKVLRLSMMDQLGTYAIIEGSSSSIIEWTPALLTMALWLDANDASTYTLSGSDVLSIRDKSGAGIFTSNSGPNRFTKLDNAVNGKSVLHCPGTNSSLNFSSVPPVVNTIIIVFRWHTAPEASEHIFYDSDSYHGNGSTSITGPVFAAIGAQYGYNATLYANGDSISTTGASLNKSNQVQIAVLEHNTISNRFYGIGYADDVFPTRCPNIDYCEIIVTNTRLSISDRQKLEGYLAHKWAVEIPVSHPYYTAAPTTDTNTDLYWAQTVLCMPMNGVPESQYTQDLKNNKVTTYGNAKLSYDTKKFGNTSAYFDGVGDYLSIKNSSLFHFLDSSFTLEFWVNFTAVPSNGNYAALITLRQTSGTNSSFAFFYGGTEKFYFSYSTTGSNLINIFGITTFIPLTSTWYHIALVRSNNTIDLYINGQKQTSCSIVGSLFQSTADLQIGATNQTSASYPFNGYIDDLRITKGVARYTADFELPTKSIEETCPIYNIIKNDQYWYNNVLTLDMELSFADIKGNILTPVNSIGTSTTNKKFGTSSAYFNGSNQYLTMPTGWEFDFGTDDFTIELWVYAIDYTIQRQLLYKYVTWASNADFALRLEVGGRVRFIGGDSAAISMYSTNSVPLNTWTHIAVSRNTGVTQLYINGALEASHTGSVLIPNDGTTLWIGTFDASEATRFYGYMDDVRITKNIGRYPSAFTPPTKSYFDNTDLANQVDPYWSSVYLEFTIEDSIVSSIEKNIPILLNISDSSGITDVDVSPILDSIKTDYAKRYGINPRNSEFGILKSGLSDFNTPYATKASNQFGVIDAAYKFNGNVNSIINITNCISRSSLMYSLTFSMWIKLDTLQNSSTEVLIFGTTGISEFQITHRSNGELVYRHTSSGTIIGWVRRNKWSHVVVTRDYTSKTVNCYVDGILRAQYTYTTNPAATSDQIYIGGSTTAASACTLSDIQLFDRVLTNDSIQQLYYTNKEQFKGLATSILYQDVPVLLGESLSSIVASSADSVYYSLSQNKSTYYIFTTVWKAIATIDPNIHGFVGETAPYYWDDDSSEWVYSNGTMEDTISLAMQYTGNRMDVSKLNGISNFSGIYSSSVGTIHIAVTLDADGSVCSFSGVTINNKQYWISESFALSDFCATVSSSALIFHLNVPDTTTDYLSATKVYCKLDNGSSWVECVNGTIPNIPTGLSTSNRTALFKVVWDISVWITPREFSLELIIK